MTPTIATLAWVSLLSALSLQAHAAAPTPNQKAEAEARAFLTPCALPASDVQPITLRPQQICLRNQQYFILEYIKAKAGIPTNIMGVASYFLPPHPNPMPGGEKRVGEPVSPFQVCVWRSVYSILPLTAQEMRERPALRESIVENKRRYPERACAKLSLPEQIAARQRAEQLLQEILTAPTTVPPPGWRPKMAGLFEDKPSPPVPDECILRTSRPLWSDTPSSPDRLPPKGCPGNP